MKCSEGLAQQIRLVLSSSIKERQEIDKERQRMLEFNVFQSVERSTVNFVNF